MLVLPLFVAVIGFHKPTWTPVLDLAQTEMRVRDVGTSHTPLIGLPGRILYEMIGVPEDIARVAFRTAAQKIGITTKFVSRTRAL